MKRSLVIGLCLITLSSVVGCGRTQTTAASWAFDSVKWHNHIYRVTTETVGGVGQQIGVVTNYSDNEATPETGTFSNKYPVGTKLFSILNTDTIDAIAVQTKDGSYLKAVDQNKNTN